MESIKQEIINNIYENGENLITGPVLQEVLLDMVDDVNGKVASASSGIVDKTGSWDEAADWVEENSSSLVHEADLAGYATEQWVEDQGYLKEVPEGYATTESLNDLSESVAEAIESIPQVDLSGYATTESVNEATESVKDWVEAKHYLTTASLSGSVTEESVKFMINDATASVKDWVGDQNYATEAWVQEQGYLTEHQDISGLATTESVNQLSESVAETIESLPQVDLNGYVTTASYNVDSASFDQRINNIPVVDPSEYVTTSSFGDLEGRVDTLKEDVANLANARDALEGAEIITWDDENEEWTAVPLVTSESVGLLSQSVRSLGNQVNGFGEDLDTLNGTVAGLASTSSLNSLSESVATDLGSLDERVTEVESGKVDWDTYDTERAEFSQSVANDFASLNIPDVSGYATTESVNNLSSSVGNISASFAETIANIPTGSGGSGSSDGLWERGNDETGIKQADSDLIALNHSVAQGSGTTASGQYSHAEGYQTKALGNYSHAEGGYFVIASGEYSHAEGSDTQAKGKYSHAEGASTVASGGYSHAEGYQTLAEGSSSHAEGRLTVAKNWYETAVGIFNATESGQIFSVGIGNPIGCSRQNGLTIIRNNPGLNECGKSKMYVYGVGGYNGFSTASALDLATVINNITGSSGEDTDLRNFLFGVESQTLTGITGSSTNILSTISGDTTLGFSAVPDNGTSLGITILNEGSSEATVTLPNSITIGSTTYNVINNGQDSQGSMKIPAGEYGDIVVTRLNSSLFVRTSIDLDSIDIDLSGYATTASVNQLSSSVATDIQTAREEASDAIYLLGGQVQGIETNVSNLSASFDTRINNITGSGADLSGYATTESVNNFSESVAADISNIPTLEISWKDWGSVTNNTLLFASDSKVINNNNYTVSEDLSLSLESIPVGYTVCANIHNTSNTEVTLNLPSQNANSKNMVYNCIPGTSSMMLYPDMWATLVFTAINNSTILCNFPQEALVPVTSSEE